MKNAIIKLDGNSLRGKLKQMVINKSIYRRWKIYILLADPLSRRARQSNAMGECEKGKTRESFSPSARMEKGGKTRKIIFQLTKSREKISFHF